MLVMSTKGILEQKESALFEESFSTRYIKSKTYFSDHQCSLGRVSFVCDTMGDPLGAVGSMKTVQKIENDKILPIKALY